MRFHTALDLRINVKKIFLPLCVLEISFFAIAIYNRSRLCLSRSSYRMNLLWKGVPGLHFRLGIISACISLLQWGYGVTLEKYVKTYSQSSILTHLEIHQNHRSYSILFHLGHILSTHCISHPIPH